MQIEQIAVSDLKEYGRNSRTHDKAQIQAVVASITEFGFTNPLLVRDDNTILAGHGRLAAARAMGLQQVPCIRLSHLTPDQARAYVIADNALAEQAGWDKDILKLELADLQAANFNLDLLGLDNLDILLAQMPGQAGLTDADDIPPAPLEPISKPGDIWALGPHRLMCGSSTDADAVKSLLGGGVPHLMVTDPPYGVEYDASWRTMAGISGTGTAAGKVLNDDRADWREAWALFPGDVAYVWHASVFSPEVAASLESCNFERRGLIIWAKSNFAISRGHYHHQHEPCWYVVRKGATGHWAGGRKKTTLWRFIDDVLAPGEDVFLRRADAETVHAISGNETTVWDIPKPMKSETGHSTQKPVECMRRPIHNNSLVGDSIYEPFSGSGTTLIAAEETGRICYAMELNPLYVDIAVTRWENFTGKKAELTNP